MMTKCEKGGVVLDHEKKDYQQHSSINSIGQTGTTEESAILSSGLELVQGFGRLLRHGNALTTPLCVVERAWEQVMRMS